MFILLMEDEMAKLIVADDFAVTGGVTDYGIIFLGTDYVTTSSIFGVLLAEGIGLQFRGRNFKYEDGMPVSGTVTGYTAMGPSGRVAELSGFDIGISKFMKVASTTSLNDDARLLNSIYSGNDSLTGSLLDDKLGGGAGNDRIFGRLGADEMTGGKGADKFVFMAFLDSIALPGEYDTITDFSRSQGDKIEMKKLDANLTIVGQQDATFIGDSDFSGKAGELQAYALRGTAYALIDVDGDAVEDFGLVLEDVSSISRSDFIF